MKQAVSEGRFQRDGEGRPHKPLRFWLRCREQYFFPDRPPLDPLECTPKLTEEKEMNLIKSVEKGKEVQRRKKALKERRGR